jgi:hypothetical protein
VIDTAVWNFHIKFPKLSAVAFTSLAIYHPIDCSRQQYNATAENGSQLYTRRNSIPLFLMRSHVIQHDYIHPCQNRYVQNLWNQTELNLPVLPKDVSKLQIGSLNVQQIT